MRFKRSVGRESARDEALSSGQKRSFGMKELCQLCLVLIFILAVLRLTTAIPTLYLLVPGLLAAGFLWIASKV
jgi:hypothetical protein